MPDVRNMRRILCADGNLRETEAIHIINALDEQGQLWLEDALKRMSREIEDGRASSKLSRSGLRGLVG